MRIKVCGLTRHEDAYLAAQLGAFALGFVFYEPSPRSVSPEAAGQIITQLPNAPWKVGVFVNADRDTILQTAKTAGLTHLQLHGDESPNFCDDLSSTAQLPVIKAFRLNHAEDIQQINQYPNIFAPLIDAAVPGAWGGTGTQANWEWVNMINHPKLILAGGLNPDNIASASAQVKPFMLDLSSGVESAPGIKDAAKLNQLFTSINSVSNLTLPRKGHA